MYCLAFVISFHSIVFFRLSFYLAHASSHLVLLTLFLVAASFLFENDFEPIALQFILRFQSTLLMIMECTRISLSGNSPWTLAHVTWMTCARNQTSQFHWNFLSYVFFSLLQFNVFLFLFYRNCGKGRKFKRQAELFKFIESNVGATIMTYACHTHVTFFLLQKVHFRCCWHYL